MLGKFKDHLQTELKNIEESGLFKRERVITSEQGAVVKVNGKDVIIFCANNYLGLSSHPKVVEAAHKINSGIDVKESAIGEDFYFIEEDDPKAVQEKIISTK